MKQIVVGSGTRMEIPVGAAPPRARFSFHSRLVRGGLECALAHRTMSAAAERNNSTHIHAISEPHFCPSVFSQESEPRWVCTACDRMCECTYVQCTSATRPLSVVGTPSCFFGSLGAYFPIPNGSDEMHGEEWETIAPHCLSQRNG